jgi:hypothetical protein
MGRRQAGIAKNMIEGRRRRKELGKRLKEMGGGDRRNENEEAGTGRNGQRGCRRQIGMGRRK